MNDRADPRERDRRPRPRRSCSTPGWRAWLRDAARATVRSACSREAARTRGFGDFWGHTLVARGAGEAMIEPELNIWDYAAFQVVVEEAGGRVTQLDGSPTRARRQRGLVERRAARRDPVGARRLNPSRRSQSSSVSPRSPAPRHHRVRGRDVLHADPGEVAHGELRLAGATGSLARADRAELDRPRAPGRARAAARRAASTGRANRRPARRPVAGSRDRAPACRARRSRRP